MIALFSIVYNQKTNQASSRCTLCDTKCQLSTLNGNFCVLLSFRLTTLDVNSHLGAIVCKLLSPQGSLGLWTKRSSTRCTVARVWCCWTERTSTRCTVARDRCYLGPSWTSSVTSSMKALSDDKYLGVRAARQRAAITRALFALF